MTKTPEEALDEVSSELGPPEPPRHDRYTWSHKRVERLAALGYTLIPTPDNPAFEEMVGKGAEGLCDRERGQKGSWAQMLVKHNAGSKQPAVPRLLADTRSVLIAAMEYKK